MNAGASPDSDDYSNNILLKVIHVCFTTAVNMSSMNSFILQMLYCNMRAIKC